MEGLEPHHTEDWAVESEGAARVFGYIPKIRDTGIDVNTLTLDCRLLVEGEHRVIGYAPGPRLVSAVAPIVGIARRCEARDCEEPAVTFISCPLACHCSEWFCSDHAAVWS